MDAWHLSKKDRGYCIVCMMHKYAVLQAVEVSAVLFVHD